MNWCLVLSLALLGVAMGVLSLFGLTRHGIEPALWLVIALLGAFWIGRRAGAKPFLHGLLAGLGCGALNGLVQAAFFGRYLASNPESAEAFSKTPGGLDPRLFVLVFSTVIGIVYGLVVGGLSVLAARMLGGKESACCN